MENYTECLVSAAFMGGSFYCMLSDYNVKQDALYKELSPEAQNSYEKIVKERITIFIIATIIGLLVSTYINKFNLNFNPMSSCNSCFNKSCISTATFYFVQYMVYSLHPKSDFVLNHVENQYQIKLWLQKYNYMKNKWHMGLLLGIVGYFMASYISFKLSDETTKDLGKIIINEESI